VNCYHSLLFLSLFSSSCNGQVKNEATGTTIEHTQELKRVAHAGAKLVRTKGTSSGNIGCELQDRAGNIWFSAGGEGAYCYDGSTFKNFTERDGLCGSVGKIIQDKAGNILLATDNGICKYENGKFKSYFTEDSLKSLNVTSLLEDRNGHLWFGAMGKGIYHYDGKTLHNYLSDGSFNRGNSYQLILDILEDANGNLWFSSWNRGGVWRYDGEGFINFLPDSSYYIANEEENALQQSLYNFRPRDAEVINTICDDMIFSVSEDKAGNIWFATRRHGACRYDGNVFTSFGEQQGFISYGIYSILEDSKGNIWFTTERNGVWRFDGKTFKNFTVVQGLVNNSVFSVLEDREGNLWFGTRGFGLSRYDGEHFLTFSE